ncbi:hypothetical protein [Planosporangium mesophilum]|uniref:Uncharacterized protein n=1 Tax=Planosporangium mesophilum TaxID=689768 RepID=A0A8J3T990_9ACTN|nr:hypothetical protein [Planosporangium mesophilum]NJC81379.1 hypothetical protein [Planosporangium mesophilum]GII20967.1 hypothetical protein Pme01_05640 [Planosporangium mesophilum]
MKTATLALVAAGLFIAGVLTGVWPGTASIVGVDAVRMNRPPVAGPEPAAPAPGTATTLPAPGPAAAAPVRGPAATLPALRPAPGLETAAPGRQLGAVEVVARPVSRGRLGEQVSSPVPSQQGGSKGRGDRRLRDNHGRENGHGNGNGHRDDHQSGRGEHRKGHGGTSIL